MTKIDLVKRIIDNEFEGSTMVAEDMLHELMNKHAYLFEKYYRYGKDYEGSDDYFRLYSCITGVIYDMICGI